MLHLLFGRAGSGKTETTRRRLGQLAKAGRERLFLLVPEQASFVNERAILQLLGPRLAGKVQVLSFSRLCDALFRQYGGSAGRRLDDGGRAVFMSLAVESVKDTLQYYRRSAEGIELVHLLLDANAEFHSCGIGPEDLRTAAAQTESPALRQKLMELAQILAAYAALVAQDWIDPQEDLDRAAATLQSHPFFADAVVFVDGYQSFTKQQYAVLRPILRQAAEVTVSLCADRLDDPERGMGVFSIVKQTAATLLRCAHEEGVPVAAPEILPPGARFLSPDLAAVEARVYRSAPLPADCSAQHVTLYAARDVYDEADFTAATIRRLLATGACRARDIVVMARSLDDYRGILDAALEMYEIPYFMDEARDITHEPLMRYVLSAFEVARTGFDTDAVLACIKTGLAGIDGDTAAALENYCFIWKISGKAWRTPFTAHPEGFSNDWTAENRARLEQLEAARRTVVTPLESFAARTANATGQAIAGAVYDLLQAADVPKHLRALAAQLEAGGHPALGDDALRLWDLLMQVLDQCALVLGDRPVGRTRFGELLRVILAGSRMADIPQGVDEVTVGAADRIRTESPRVVFVLGAARGDFPRAPGTVGVLSFAERLALIRGGLPLNDTLEGVDVQERFLAYAAVSAARERLCISWPAAAVDGTPKELSSLVEQVQKAVRNVPVRSAGTMPAAYFAVSRAAAFSQLARRWGHCDGEEAALRKLFDGPEDAPRLEALDRAAGQTPDAIRSPALAQALFGRRMHISASQAEAYALCPFAYFCKYGLRARPRRAAELDPLEYGSLMHYLLEHLFRDIGANAIAQMAEKALRKCISDLLAQYAEQMLGGMADKGPRFRFLLDRVTEAAAVVAAHIAQELCQSAFQPVDFELPVGGEGGVPGLFLELPDGGEVEIVGKIDRVDAWQEGGHTWLRVVDYKTGRKKFRMADLLDGMNMQMLLYLAALYENGGARYPNPMPAGVLYMPAAVPAAPVDRSTPADKRRKKQAMELRMFGVVRADPSIITAMDASGAKQYIPVGLKKGAPDGAGSAVTGVEFDALLAYVKEQVRQMAAALHSGHVEARPLQGAYDACAWCDYAAVCGHEPDGPARQSDGRKPAQALRAILEKEEGLA